ncbi:MAG TPA: hypothetical protein VMT66_00685 [Steroidobacteraceae bacterium]|nr:hypothetical protein [Steroidobacteraceae bacterium]
MLLRSLAFLALFALLQLSWQALRGTAAEHFIIHDCTVVPAAQLVRILTPQVQVRAAERSLKAPGGGLNILNGCEGMEALLLLTAAFAVAPIPWRERLKGLLLGMVVVFFVNQMRILLLFYGYRANPAWFDALHATITPIGVILAVSAYFYAWLLHSRRPTPAR